MWVLLTVALSAFSSVELSVDLMVALRAIELVVMTDWKAMLKVVQKDVLMAEN